MESKSRAYLLEVHVRPLESTLLSNSMSRIRDLELQLASNNLELDLAAGALESTRPRFRFSRDAAGVMRRHVKS